MPSTVTTGRFAPNRKIWAGSDWSKSWLGGDRMTHKCRRSTDKNEANRTPATKHRGKENLARIIDQENPRAKNRDYWVELLARIVATCDELSPDWRDKE